jgi:hypothetical protein
MALITIGICVNDFLLSINQPRVIWKGIRINFILKKWLRWRGLD